MVYKCIKYTINAVSVADIVSQQLRSWNWRPDCGNTIYFFPTCIYRHSCKSCLVTTHPCSTFLFLFFLYALGRQSVYIVVCILNLISTSWSYSTVKTTYLSTLLNSLIFKGSATVIHLYNMVDWFYNFKNNKFIICTFCYYLLTI